IASLLPTLNSVRLSRYAHSPSAASAPPPRTPPAGDRRRVRAMSISIHEELRHRGEPLVAYPGADLWKAEGGCDGVAALVEDLYRRIEQDDVLRVAFPHFNSGEAAPFFIQWFGGSRGYSDDVAGGLLRRHQHRYVSPRAAAAWLRCMREALEARGLDAEPILQPLARIAKAMIHSPSRTPKTFSGAATPSRMRRRCSSRRFS